MDIKQIVGAFEAKTKTEQDKREAARAAQAQTEKLNIEKLQSWAVETLLPILSRIEAELKGVGYPANIVRRPAKDTSDGGRRQYAEPLRDYLAQVELRASKLKGDSAGGSDYIRWSWTPRDTSVKVESRHSSALDSIKDRGTKQLAELSDPLFIEREIELFLKQLFR